MPPPEDFTDLYFLFLLRHPSTLKFIRSHEVVRPAFSRPSCFVFAKWGVRQGCGSDGKVDQVGCAKKVEVWKSFPIYAQRWENEAQKGRRYPSLHTIWAEFGEFIFVELPTVSICVNFTYKSIPGPICYADRDHLRNYWESTTCGKLKITMDWHWYLCRNHGSLLSLRNIQPVPKHLLEVTKSILKPNLPTPFASLHITRSIILKLVEVYYLARAKQEGPDNAGLTTKWDFLCDIVRGQD